MRLFCRCFAIDRSGFVIAHQDFLVNPPSAQVHITTKEPEIAADMVSRNIVTGDSCVNYADITNQRFYMVLLTRKSNQTQPVLFKKILSTNSCLHTLVSPERNNEVLSKLRKPLKYPVGLPYSRTKRYQPFLNYALAHFQTANELVCFCSSVYVVNCV